MGLMVRHRSEQLPGMVAGSDWSVFRHFVLWLGCCVKEMCIHISGLMGCVSGSDRGK
jgi:hypothetical protein